MASGYRESHLAEGKGQSYNRRFAENPYRSMIWEAEKRFLDDLLPRYWRDAKPRHLDFACGAGRILKHLEGRTQEAVGVDLSPSMLEVARQTLSEVEIIEADITVDDALGDRQFDLVTAFRFFPNAEQSLRDAAMKAILKHLVPEGLMVFNNHKNLHSTRNRLARMLNRGRTEDLSLAATLQFIALHGLRIRRCYHVGVLPSSERGLVLPRPLLVPTERFLSGLPFLRGFAENLVFVCSR